MYTNTKVIIFLGIVTFTISSLIIGHNSNLSSTTNDLFINLAAGGITTLLTLFGVDFLLQRSEKLKWQEAKKTAKSDMIFLTNMLISHVSIPLGYKPTDYEIDRDNLEESSRQLMKIILGDLLKNDTTKLLRELSEKDWEHLQLNLFIIHHSLSETLQVYGQVIPPEVFGKLLAVRKSFQSFYFSFGLVPELFTKTQSNWPANNGGLENNKLIRANVLESLSVELAGYFKGLCGLIDLVDTWK